MIQLYNPHISGVWGGERKRKMERNSTERSSLSTSGQICNSPHCVKGAFLVHLNRPSAQNDAHRRHNANRRWVTTGAARFQWHLTIQSTGPTLSRLCSDWPVVSRRGNSIRADTARLYSCQTVGTSWPLCLPTPGGIQMCNLPIMHLWLMRDAKDFPGGEFFSISVQSKQRADTSRLFYNALICFYVQSTREHNSASSKRTRHLQASIV